MATTTNFGWETPDDTDLVKDGALAMRTLGNAIDASLVDLKGGTTGQVLSKTSNTDMDFTWVTSDDANAIQNAIVDAKGDLITATAADTPSRIAVGNNGETLVADSSASTGLRWQGNFAAGKNKIINGDFAINARSFSSTQSGVVFTFDRWLTEGNGGVGTLTWSAQTFTPGTAPVAGYEGVNFLRMASTSQSTSTNYMLIDQKIEDVRTLAGQTATLSFWAKASSGTPKVGTSLVQTFGSGGSSAVITKSGDVTISTSWARYSVTIALPSISGKTIGTNSYLRTLLFTSAGSAFNSYTDIGVQNATIELWGIQLEAGNTATAFQTATGTLAGERSACERYYWRGGNGSAGIFNGGSTARYDVRFPTTMRIAPTITAIAAPQVMNPTVAESQTGSQTANFLATATGGLITVNAASKIQFGGFSSGTDGRPTNLLNDALEFSAEL